ncbi:MAG: tRNA uridine-5-carboxymethylaminomethyl(34) synthesis GTPase MnmE [Bacilli bacterium]
MQTDTIAAIATSLGEGAIAIVRLSGPQAISICEPFFKGKKLSTVDSHTIHYGKLVYPQTGEMIEEVLVAVMRAPRTFTREDVVEINCHGGIASVQRVLAMLIEAGAKLAEPGEFTKRAFLNGRIDLSQAEAVMDLIRAKTDESLDVALKQVEGRLSYLIRSLRQTILETLAHVEVNIDYPEYDDVEEMTTQLILPPVRQMTAEIEKLLETAKQGKIYREGIQTAIVGRPNVGKSSLLNSLIRETKAIVTDIEGTTRDIIEEYVNVKGIPLKLLDTAGIRETSDIVEQIGVEKSREALEKADLVLLVLNGAEPLTESDRILLERTKQKTRIILINKSDLQQHISDEDLAPYIGDSVVVHTSTVDYAGLDKLEDAVGRLFFEGGIGGKDATYVSNARHIGLLRQALKCLKDAEQAAMSGMPIDLIQIDMTRAWELLGEIIGQQVEESLIDQLFSQFCLGK